MNLTNPIHGATLFIGGANDGKRKQAMARLLEKYPSEANRGNGENRNIVNRHS